MKLTKEEAELKAWICKNYTPETGFREIESARGTKAYDLYMSGNLEDAHFAFFDMELYFAALYIHLESLRAEKALRM